MPTSVAVRVSFAKSLTETRRRVPSVIEDYNLDIPTSVMRRKIREEFEKNKLTKDLNLINIFIFKGRAEYDETVNQWKQREHIMAYIDNEEFAPKDSDFLTKFYEGK